MTIEVETLKVAPPNPCEGGVVYVSGENAMHVATRHGWLMMDGAQ